jgi:hypothetical protein
MINIKTIKINNIIINNRIMIFIQTINNNRNNFIMITKNL